MLGALRFVAYDQTMRIVYRKSHKVEVLRISVQTPRWK